MKIHEAYRLSTKIGTDTDRVGPASRVDGKTKACSVPGHQPHSLCVVCNNDYATRYICPECRLDEANANWAERSHLELPQGMNEDLTSMEAPSELTGRAREPRQLERNILDGLALRSIRMPCRVRRREGGARVWIWQWESRPLTFREVAWLVGCHPSYVLRIYRSATGNG